MSDEVNLKANAANRIRQFWRRVRVKRDVHFSLCYERTLSTVYRQHMFLSNTKSRSVGSGEQSHDSASSASLTVGGESSIDQTKSIVVEAIVRTYLVHKRTFVEQRREFVQRRMKQLAASQTDGATAATADVSFPRFPSGYLLKQCLPCGRRSVDAPCTRCIQSAQS